ncbi:hypothetical protein M8997_007765 [Phyllobacterium sp. 21LDTY02-6]|nr:hypothetical protein [Phyllobacterium sp. 21LDTY02-6]
MSHILASALAAVLFFAAVAALEVWVFAGGAFAAGALAGFFVTGFAAFAGASGDAETVSAFTGFAAAFAVVLAFFAGALAGFFVAGFAAFAGASDKAGAASAFTGFLSVAAVALRAGAFARAVSFATFTSQLSLLWATASPNCRSMLPNNMYYCERP